MSTAYSSAKQQYIGNGVTTEWGFDFPIKKHSELKVYLKRSGSTQVLLEEGVDYSFVTENTIAFPIKTGEAKLQAADVLALQRESVFESEYNFSNQQRLEPEEVMHADDNLERQIQELKRDVTQAIRIQPTSNINTDEYFIAVESIYENLDNINNVSGISSEIVNCSDNISDISTVSTNIANVNAVGQSISSVNTVAGNVSSVNTVAGVSTDVTTVASIASSVPTVANNDANITTVANNISDVNTAATNIAAIKAAPTAATNAANSANNSHIWAEGTDAQVQALGGVHSSKVWASQEANNYRVEANGSTTFRALKDRFADYGNVKDYGAKGDGITDDTSAFNNCLASHNFVFIPDGTYRITDTISFMNKTLIGSNELTTIIVMDTPDDTKPILKLGRTCVVKNMLLRFKPSLITGLEFENRRVAIWCKGGASDYDLQRGSLISNLRIDNVGTGISDGGGGCFSVTFQDIEITNFTNSGIYFTGMNTGNVFRNIYISNIDAPERNTENGFISTGTVNAMTIEQLNIEHLTANSVFRLSNATDFLITGLHIEGCTVRSAYNGFLTFNRSSGVINGVEFYYTRYISSGISLINLQNAGVSSEYSSFSTTNTSKIIVKNLVCVGLNEPDRTIFPSFPEESRGLINATDPLFVFRDYNAYTNKDYIFSIENYSYVCQSTDATIYENCRIDSIDRIEILNRGQTKFSGSTADRPTTRLCPYHTEYFDTDINSLVIWNGSSWVNA